MKEEKRRRETELEFESFCVFSQTAKISLMSYVNARGRPDYMYGA